MPAETSMPAKTAKSRRTLAERLAALDWEAVERSLWERGHARTTPVLRADECRALAALYGDDARFRKRVVMERHRYGLGEYKYFASPLPGLVGELREHAYAPLAAVANRWMEALRLDERYPATLAAFLERCADQGQSQPTPLMLSYEEGGYNCLHQDLYGEVAFPFQIVVQLDRAGTDYTGGEFLLVEQRPRAQSIGEAIAAARGELVIFTTRIRPVAGSRGYYRVNVRHGVSRLHSGKRRALGVIFHDAR